jgi:hypothetical protein
LFSDIPDRDTRLAGISGLVVSGEENHMLLRPMEDVEMENAVFQADGDKAPGPDGFPACFYQIYWDIVGKDV